MPAQKEFYRPKKHGSPDAPDRYAEWKNSKYRTPGKKETKDRPGGLSIRCEKNF